MAEVSRGLLAAVCARYGLQAMGEPRSLEDSFNLNVVLGHGDQRVVVRVYQPSMTVPRLAALQRVRTFLIAGGLPFAPLRLTLDGAGWCEFDGRLIEVDEYVPSETFMDSFEHIHLAMPVFARLHSRLRLVPVTETAAIAPTANHVEASRVVEAVATGLEAWRGEASAAETRYATIAETLSRQLWQVEEPYEKQIPRQLVHGDFWDDNVKFTGSRITLITDLDFMGHRPRIDDLALTLFFTNERLGRQDTSRRRRDQLRRLVDAYDGALNPPLSMTERQALPYAIARTPLCFIAQLAQQAPRAETEQASAARVLSSRGPALSWALAVINSTEWTAAFLT